MLAVYIMIMFGCVGGIFWNEFLLKTSIQYSCNPSGVECFIIENFWDILKFDEPIDCNDVASRVSGNLTFVCYKYKFDINGASWTAGHVFGISTFIIKALPACFHFLKQCDAQRHRKLRYLIVLLSHSRTGIMTGCKIIDFCLQKSIEIVGIHSVEAECKAWHGGT